MSGRIEPGALVMIVRGHKCVYDKAAGIPFRVASLVPQFGGGWHCGFCKKRDIAPEATMGAEFEGYPGQFTPTIWLRRLDDPSAPEGVTREKELAE